MPGRGEPDALSGRNRFPEQGLSSGQLAELLHCVASHHDLRAARTAEAAVLYHANQLDSVAQTRRVD